jgi:hypothetical protein
MGGPAVTSGFVDDLKAVANRNPNFKVECVWNDLVERFQIKAKDNRTSREFILYQIETEDGHFRQPGHQDIICLMNEIAWDHLGMYPDVTALWTKIFKDNDIRKMKAKERAMEYKKWWNKEHRKEWRQAIEYFRSTGRTSRPKAQKESKIIV